MLLLLQKHPKNFASKIHLIKRIELTAKDNFFNSIFNPLKKHDTWQIY